MPPPTADDQAGTACRPSRRSVDWHWATPRAQRILADGLPDNRIAASQALEWLRKELAG
jgi:hypothetical protein